MGSTLVCRPHAYVARPQLEEWVKTVQADAAFSNGHEYSGDWNMCHGLEVHDRKVFASENEANEYICETAQKWENLIAVPFLSKRTLHQDEALSDARYKELHDRLEADRSTAWQFDSLIVKRVREGKSQFRACPHCESKIAVKHVHQVHCPVCRGVMLRTASDEKLLAARKDRIARLEMALQERMDKLVQQRTGSKEPEKLWLVGGWCAS